MTWEATWVCFSVQVLSPLLNFWIWSLTIAPISIARKIGHQRSQNQIIVLTGKLVCKTAPDARHDSLLTMLAIVGITIGRDLHSIWVATGITSVVT